MLPNFWTHLEQQQVEPGDGQSHQDRGQDKDGHMVPATGDARSICLRMICPSKKWVCFKQNNTSTPEKNMKKSQKMVLLFVDVGEK